MTPKFSPPRPAPPPEPWPPQGPAITPGFVALLAIAAIILAATAAIWLRRWKRDRPASAAVPPSPEGWGEWSRLVREALAARIGPQILAQTTEEITSSPPFREGLDPELADRIRNFLQTADLAQFDPSAEASAEAGRAEASALAESLAAGASSRITGK